MWVLREGQRSKLFSILSLCPPLSFSQLSESKSACLYLSVNTLYLFLTKGFVLSLHGTDDMGGGGHGTRHTNEGYFREFYKGFSH